MATGPTYPSAPTPQSQMVDSRGFVTDYWYRFFMLLFKQVSSNTTGKSAPVPITVTASPFSYVPTTPGTLLISGGGIENVEFSRDGITFYTIGSFRGSIPMAASDRVRITYMTGNAPTLTFIPM